MSSFGHRFQKWLHKSDGSHHGSVGSGITASMHPNDKVTVSGKQVTIRTALAQGTSHKCRVC
eukprot:m.104827 g.104827  ORF g.104827 m.104827 type:complete len:62 (-) comp13263_c0_seq3:88-273(-)